MLKYLNTKVTFAEVPDEITLCIEITGCKIRCKNCHSPYLAEDIGKVLDNKAITTLISVNKGITCVSIMGGDSDTISVNNLAEYIKFKWSNIRIAWYSGRQELSKDIDLKNFDYIKLGPYIEEFGPLNSETTNQRFYKVHKKVVNGIEGYELEDKTYKFCKHEIEN